LYKYLEEERLLERFEELIQLLLKFTIRPIFVFDGKPPEEKFALLRERNTKKNEAETHYKTLAENTNANIENVAKEMKMLKTKFIRVTPSHIQSVKIIMDKYNIEHIDAECEADQVCVKYVKSRKAWGCVSDDMDMFVYGCTRVLRRLCIDKCTIDLYELPSILTEIRMSMKQFREIMVLSGTDYNIEGHISLFHILHMFREYKHCTTTQFIGFYDWLRERTHYIKDYDKLIKINAMFSIL
jgi:flap endonuclease-1